MFSIDSKGSFDNLERFLKKAESGDLFKSLDKYGQEGVSALAAATPVESGETANSWSYEVKDDGKSVSVIWSNSNVVDGRPIAILIQYGHGTGTGGYVQGRDYINPTLRPLFDRMTNDIWKEVTAR